MMKVKLLSANAVITHWQRQTGLQPLGLALNALQNSMMFRPRWLQAGPMAEGIGLLPAGTCSLMKPTIFLRHSGLLTGTSLQKPQAPQGCRLVDTEGVGGH